MRIHYFDNNNEFYVCISTVQILENVAIEADLEKGEAYFEGSVKFMKTLNEVLDMLIGEVSIITANSILSLSYEDIPKYFGIYYINKIIFHLGGRTCC